MSLIEFIKIEFAFLILNLEYGSFIIELNSKLISLIKESFKIFDIGVLLFEEDFVGNG